MRERADVILLAPLSVAEALAGVEDGATTYRDGDGDRRAILNLDYRGEQRLGPQVGSRGFVGRSRAMAYRNKTKDPPSYDGPPLCLYSAAAERLTPIDSVYVHFNDLDGLRADATAGVRDGFTGKMAIHPAQVPVINEIFTPTKAALEWAQGVLAAFKANPGAGVLNYKGEMIDKPHIDRAERLMARAKAAGLL